MAVSSNPATWRRHNERQSYAGTVEDIGPGGAFLRTSASTIGIAPGVDLILGVTLPGSLAAAELAARVAWSAPGEDGFGVEFRCRDAGGQRRLKEVVRRLELIERQALLLNGAEEEEEE